MIKVIQVTIMALMLLLASIVMVRMASWHSANDIKKVITEKHCDLYKFNLRFWKKQYGQEWLNYVKKEHPESWQTYSNLFKQGLDAVLPD